MIRDLPRMHKFQAACTSRIAQPAACHTCATFCWSLIGTGRERQRWLGVREHIWTANRYWKVYSSADWARCPIAKLGDLSKPAQAFHILRPGTPISRCACMCVCVQCIFQGSVVCAVLVSTTLANSCLDVVFLFLWVSNMATNFQLSHQANDVTNVSNLVSPTRLVALPSCGFMLPPSHWEFIFYLLSLSSRFMCK